MIIFEFFLAFTCNYYYCYFCEMQNIYKTVYKQKWRGKAHYANA